MKYRVKFRIVQDAGSTGKIAINVKEGESFSFTDSTLNIQGSGTEPRTHFTLSVKNMTTTLHADENTTNTSDVRVNGTAGTEFRIHSGDIVTAAGKTIEFIDAPEPAHDEVSITLDMDKLRSAPPTDPTQAEALSPEPEAIDPEKLQQSQRWKEDLDDSKVLKRKKDWKRKAALGSLAATFVGALVFVFAIGSKTTHMNPGRLPASMPKAVVEPVEPVEPVQVVTAPHLDSSYVDLHKLIDSAYIKHENRSIALNNNNAATQQFAALKTKFFSAVRYGDLSTVRKMVGSQEINPETATESGATTLMQASYYGQLEIIKFLISRKIDVNNKDVMGATALMYASRGNQLKTAKYLLSHGANASLQMNDGSRAFDVAKKAHHQAMMQLLDQAMSGRKVASKAGSIRHGKKKKKKKNS